MPRCTYACGTADHAVSRRAFLGAGSRRARPRRVRHAAAAAANCAKAQKRVLVDLPRRRRQPARNLGPEARHRHRRAVPGHPDLRARHAHLRAAAAHREADAPAGPGPRHQHRRGRPRQRARTSCTPAAGRSRASSTRTSARSRPSCSARDDNAAARLHPHHAARRRRLRQRSDAAFLGPQYASVVARRRQAAGRTCSGPPTSPTTPTGQREDAAQEAQRPLRQVAPQRRRPKPTPSRTTRPSS